MLAKTLPLLLLCACASTAPMPTHVQPELARLAQPYADDLRAEGITRVESSGSGAMVKLDTVSGAVYVQYPKSVPSLTFALDIDPDGLRAYSVAPDAIRDAPVLAALLPQAIQAAARNNEFIWLRNNPWN